MHILVVCVLATLALVVHGQNGKFTSTMQLMAVEYVTLLCALKPIVDDSGGDSSSDNGGDRGDNTDQIVATSVIVSVVLVIVVGLTITMW